MAYELRDQVRPEDQIYHFVPSNPWIAVGWHKRDDITRDLAPAMAKKGIAFKTVAAEKVHPTENRGKLVDGSSRTSAIWCAGKSRIRSAPRIQSVWRVPAILASPLSPSHRFRRAR